MATGHTAGDEQSWWSRERRTCCCRSSVARRPAKAARAWVTERATEGSRVLVVLEGCGSPIGDELPADLSLVGLVALTDPPRDDLVPVLTTLADAGIRVTMMTGDHPATAQAVGRRVGLLPADSTTPVRTGADLVGEVTPELAAAPVFARVRPEQKLALVRAWQEAGEVVAVTGDGVNDGPALRLADIGVAMGLGGTEVARQAATSSSPTTDCRPSWQRSRKADASTTTCVVTCDTHSAAASRRCWSCSLHRSLGSRCRCCRARSCG